jgi:hypothetical protein
VKAFVWAVAIGSAAGALLLFMSGVTAPSGQPLLPVRDLLNTLFCCAFLIGAGAGIWMFFLAMGSIKHRPGNEAVVFLRAVQKWALFAFVFGALLAALAAAASVLMTSWEAVDGPTMLRHLVFSARFLGVVVLGGFCALVSFAAFSRGMKWGGSYALVSRGKGV